MSSHEPEENLVIDPGVVVTAESGAGHTLAARGALPEVENAAAMYPGQFDPGAVDRMHTFRPTDEEVHAFMEEGGLVRRRRSP